MTRKTILIFDDDKTILNIFSIVLESIGYEVCTSETSHDIIEKVQEMKPDIIIMDNWIPDIGGIKATRILKEHDDFKHIPVIYCSANSNIEMLARNAGAEAHLAKPFDLDDLENAVASLIPKTP